MDPSLMDAMIAAIGTAIGAYGQAVLTTAENVAASRTVQLGQRLLGRLRHSRDTGAQIETAVLDVAEHPEDRDFQVALRALIKKALEAEPELEEDLTALLIAGGVSFPAIGDRAVAAQHNDGIISTGDNAVNRIRNS